MSACCNHQTYCKSAGCKLHSSGCTRPVVVTPVAYNRAVLVDVVIHHHKTNITGCACGWSEVGRDHGQHVADEYEKAARG